MINKQGIGELPFINLPRVPGPVMWKKMLDLNMSDVSFKAIGLSEAPSTKLSQYICRHAAGYNDWFVTIEGETAGVSISRGDLKMVKSCRISGTLHIHGCEIHSDEVKVAIYAA